MIKKILENKDKNLKLTTLGFTLIELLAVIVILAIIALIATPIVLNIIEDSKKSSTLRSAEYYMDAVEYAVANRLIDNKSLESGEYNILANGNICLVYDDNDSTKCIDELVVEVDGEKPTSGTVKIEGKEIGVSTLIFNNGTVETDEKGNFAYKEVEDSEDDTQIDNTPTEFTLSGLATTGTFTTVDGSSTSEITEVNTCATSGTCAAGTEFAIRVNENETYRFYVLSDDGNKVILIMDRNLGDPGIGWYTDDDDNSYGPITALTILKQRTLDWGYIPEYSYILEDDGSQYGIYGEVGLYGYNEVIGELVNNVRARLPKYSELTISEIGCSTTECPDYLSKNGSYWTSTTDSSTYYKAIAILNGGYVYSNDVNMSYTNIGIRPVIELSK